MLDLDKFGRFSSKIHAVGGCSSDGLDRDMSGELLGLMLTVVLLHFVIMLCIAL